MSNMTNSENSPKIRFNGFSRDWTKKKLDDIVDIIGGGTPDTNNPEFWNGEIDWYSPTEIGKSVYADKSVKSITELGLLKSSAQILPANKTVLFTSRAGIGDMAILRNEGATNQGFQSLIAKDIDVYFLYSMGSTIKNKAIKKASGSTFLEISKKQLSSIDLKITEDKNEQKAIGELFQTLDQTLTLNRQKHEKTKTLKKALISKLFPKAGQSQPEMRLKGFSGDWVENELGKVIQFYDSLRIPVTASKRITGKTPYYGANGIQGYVDGFTHYGEFALIAEDGANDLNNYPALYVNGKVWVNNHAHVVKGVEKKLNTLFLVYRIKSMDISKYLVGGSRAKLNAGTMKKIIISFPQSYEEQFAIANILKKLDGTLTLQAKQIKTLENLKKALLAKMFV